MSPPPGADARALPLEALLLEQAGVAVVAMDRDGVITGWNHHAEELFGWTRDEALGIEFAALLPAQSDAVVAEEIQATVGRGVEFVGDLLVRRKDGTTTLCRVSDSPVIGDDGTILACVAVLSEAGGDDETGRRLAARTGVPSALADSLTLEEAAPRIIRSVCENLRWAYGGLWEVDRAGGVLRCIDAWHDGSLPISDFLRATRESALPSGVGLPGRVWGTGDAHWIPDVTADTNFPRAESAARGGLHAAAGFPVTRAGQILGVLEFLSPAVLPPNDALLQTMNVIGSQIAQFMERVEVERSLRLSEANLRAILDAALDGVISIDHTGRIVEFNRSAEALFGRSRDDVVGREMAETIIPHRYRDQHREGLARYLETGEGPIIGSRVEMAGLRADGTEFPVELAVSRINAPGPPSFTGFVRDITERRQWELDVRRSHDQLEAILQGVAEGITVMSPEGRLIYANDAAARMIGYHDVSSLLAATSDEAAERFEIEDEAGTRLPLSALPGRRALMGETPDPTVLHFRTRGQLDDRWSLVRAAPILDDEGRVQFAVNIFHDITDRKRAEDAQRFLAEAGPLLASAVTDYEETLSRVADLAVPHLADWCAIDVVQDDGSVRSIKVAHTDTEKVRFAKELGERYPPDPNAATGVANVLRTGRSEIYPEIPEELIEQAAIDDEHLEIIRSLQLRSAIVVPLVARGQVLGAITLVYAESRRTYGPEDLALAEDLAARAGLAMQNAQLYAERDHIAQTLQRSLLPPELPAIPGVEVAARYRAAGAGNEVGGDFYDVFEASDGNWVAVIGDVCGKGPEAAAVTGLARHTIRAAAMRERTPSRTLEILNEALRRQRSDQVFVTVVVLRIHPAPTGTRVTVCCGGHPLPLVLRADGAVEAVGRPGTLVGIFADPEFHDRVVDLAPGDAIILFTDGVTEEHVAGRVFGREGLTDVIRRAVGETAEVIAERIEKGVVTFRPEPLRDDVAVLVIRAEPS